MKHHSFIGSIVAILTLSMVTHGEQPWIIDSHTHFKGPAQIEREGQRIKRHPQDTLGQVKVPADYRAVADRLGICSTLIVEAVQQSDPEFNDWALEQAKSDLVCGYIARGDLTKPEFVERYQRYRDTGYLKGYRIRFDKLSDYLRHDLACENLRRLEADGMVVDLLIDPKQTVDVIRLARDYPKLKIIINHCFRARIKQEKIDEPWHSAVEACAKHPNVYCKLSSILSFSEAVAFEDPAPKDLDYYLPVLQPCFDAFGEDRVIFATNWGVCTHYGEVDDVVRIAKQFLSQQSDTALRKGMRENAIRVYGIQKQQLRTSKD